MHSMTTETATERLQALLDQHGFDTARPTLDSLWTAVQAWATIPVDGMGGKHDDLILFETVLWLRPPTPRKPSRPHFLLAFTRQFQHPESDETYHGAMEQILIQLEYDPHADFRAAIPDRRGYGAQIWGNAGRDCPKWIQAVQSDPGFRAALRHTSRSVDISQGLL